MKKLLLLFILLFIQPVSNEQIQQNIGQQQYISYQQSNKARYASGYCSKTFLVNGKYYTVTYWVGYGIIVGKNAVRIINDGGLGLNSSYKDEAALFAAIAAMNNSTPIGDGIFIMTLLCIISLIFIYGRISKNRRQTCVKTCDYNR